MGHEMKKYMVGPMPVEDFLDDFFPKHELLHYCEKRAPKDPYKSVVSVQREKDSYDPFVSPSNSFLSHKSQLSLLLR
jgi:hypothetical protein